MTCDEPTSGAERAKESTSETVQRTLRTIQQEETPTMKRIMTFVSAALLTGALVTSAFAQSSHPNDPAPTTGYGEDHPHVAAAFSKHPYAFMHRERRYERGENRIEHRERGEDRIVHGRYVYGNDR